MKELLEHWPTITLFVILGALTVADKHPGIGAFLVRLAKSLT